MTKPISSCVLSLSLCLSSQKLPVKGVFAGGCHKSLSGFDRHCVWRHCLIFLTKMGLCSPWQYLDLQKHVPIEAGISSGQVFQTALLCVSLLYSTALVTSIMPSSHLWHWFPIWTIILKSFWCLINIQNRITMCSTRCVYCFCMSWAMLIMKYSNGKKWCPGGRFTIFAPSGSINPSKYEMYGTK